jgi:hypothetical protein
MVDIYRDWYSNKNEVYIKNVGVPAPLDCDHKEHDEVICPQ